MNQYISRRSFLKASGSLAASAAVMAALPAADAACPKLHQDFSLTILYTNDVHTYMDKAVPAQSYATAAAMKAAELEAGNNVLLVDAGDHVQGTAYGAMDEGATIISLMNDAGYDVATLGNHEFDYGMARAMQVIEDAEYPYISCNFIELATGKPVLAPHKTFTFDRKLGGLSSVRVAFVGISTPETMSKSTPAYFMDEKMENYLYTFCADEDGSALYKQVQKAIDAAAKCADYVIALGHIGVDESSAPYTSKEIIANTTGLTAFIDGHSHTVMPCEEVLDAAGKRVLLTQTGEYFNNIGKMTLTLDGVVSELVNVYDAADESIAAEQNAWIGSVDEMLGEKIAVSDVDFWINDPETGKRMIRTQETNLGDFCADAYYYYFNGIEELPCDIAVMNGGGIRANEKAGDWSYKTVREVNPFGNVLCLMSVKGQQIADAIEFASRFAGQGKENGGFLHVAGAVYEIDSAVTSSVKVDASGIWTGSAEGERCVKNLCIYNRETGVYEPIDVNRDYALAGTNYTLRALGDGYSMFAGAELIKDYVCEDYLATAAYAMSFNGVDADGFSHISTANSPLAAYEGYLLNYENPYGAGRIVIK